MYNQLVCPQCRLPLKKSECNLVCNKCRRQYQIKSGIPLLWQAGLTTNPLSRKMIAREIEFSHNLLHGADKKSLGPEDFFLRNIKETYASKKYEQAAFASFIKIAPEIYHNLANLKILNIGCGMGVDTAWLIKNGAKNVVCTDISWDFLDFAQKNLAKYKNKPRYFFQADGENPPVQKGSFEMIFLSSVLHHLPHPIRFLDQSAKIAPLIVATLEPSDMGVFHYFLRLLGTRREYGNLETHRLNVRQIKQHLEKLGYTVKVKTGFILFPFGIFKNKLNNKWFVDIYFIMLSIMTLIFGHWGHSFTLVATKNNY